ncbi:MAG: putative secondary metabolism biosynthetic enzyme [Bathelium mastoideum]|nr:MAG: putative secondary metabolism biosynthetic enzyme [Bathelium mastoideum]
MSNSAAWIKEEKANLTIDTAEVAEPGPDELLVKNAAIGLNPVEAKIQRLALFPLSYPTILGQSFAGTVTKVGSSVTGFQVGDRVAVNRSSAMRMKASSGSFQNYVIADSNTTSKLKEETPFSAAAATIINLATVVSALRHFLKLDLPNPKGPNPANKAKKVLIYGGSSNVGGYAVNYAVSTGYTVITTSSPPHASFVSSIGPAKVVDHTQDVSQIVSELKAEGPYFAVFDTVGLPVVTTVLGQVLQEQGGAFYTTSPPLAPVELPANVERKFESFPTVLEQPENGELREWFYNTFTAFMVIPPTQKLVAPEKIEKVEGGLEGIQGALDKLMKGVSGKKLVVEL